MSICKDCFHSYVCEQFNEHRECDNKKCRFANDHFVPAENVVKVVRCKDCKYYNPNYSKFDSDIPYNRCEHPAQQFDIECYDMWLETNLDDFCSYGERKEREGK